MPEEKISTRSISKYLFLLTALVILIIFLLQFYIKREENINITNLVLSAEENTGTEIEKEQVVYKSIKKAFVPILMYHHIGESPNPYYSSPDMYVSEKTFKDQLKYLKNKKYNTIHISDLISAFEGKSKLPKKPVILTFDDGFSEHFNIAFKQLKKNKMVGTFYIPTYVLGIDHDYWIRDWMLETMAKNNMEIGSHSVTHPILTNFDVQGLNYEIYVSKRMLETITKRPVRTFSYPSCINNQEIISKVKEANYSGGVSCGPNTIHLSNEKFALSRRTITNDMNIFKYALEKRE